MARLNEFDVDAAIGELETICACVEALTSEIKMTGPLKERIQEENDAERKWLYATCNVENSDADLADALDKVLQSMVHGSVENYVEGAYQGVWRKLVIAKKRLEHLLDHGNIDLLDCSWEEREFFAIVWNCLEKIRSDVQPRITIKKDVASTDFASACLSKGYPDRCLKFVASFTKIADGSPRSVSFSPGVWKETRRAVKLIAQGLKPSDITTRTGLSTRNIRNMKNRFSHEILAMQNGTFQE